LIFRLVIFTMGSDGLSFVEEFRRNNFRILHFCLQEEKRHPCCFLNKYGYSYMLTECNDIMLKYRIHSMVGESKIHISNVDFDKLPSHYLKNKRFVFQVSDSTTYFPHISINQHTTFKISSKLDI